MSNEKSWLLRNLEKFTDDEGKWESDMNHEFVAMIKKIVDEFPNSKMTLDDFAKNDKYDHVVVAISGGLNGNGKWADYMEDLKELFKKLQAEFGHVWLMNLDNDCPDDVWYLMIGVEKTK